MKRPLAVLILAYILGIVLGSYLKLPLFPVPASLTVEAGQLFYLFSLLLGVFLLTVLFFFKKKSLLTHIFLLLSFFLFGVFLCLSHLASWQGGANILESSPGEQQVLIGTIVKEPQIREERIFLTFKPEKIKGFTQVIVYNSHASYDYGDKIKLKGEIERPSGQRNPGGFNYRAYLARRGIYTLMRIKDENNIERIGIGRVNLAVKFALKVKERMIGIIRQTLDDPQAAVLEGIMFGKRSALPKEIREDFSNTGVGHILAVSGLHVMLILFMFLASFRASGLPAKVSALLTIICIVSYALIVGGRPSVIRASLMAVTGLSALILERDRDFYTSIALAAFVILLVNPLSLFEVSFQLSFMVVLSIICLAPYLKNITLRFLPKWLALSLSLSLSAWLGALPLIAYYFNKVSPIAVVANLLVVPLTGIVVALGFLTSLAGMVSFGLAGILGAANWLVLSGLVKAVRLFASLPSAFLSVSPPPLILVTGYYGSIALLVRFLPPSARIPVPARQGRQG